MSGYVKIYGSILGSSVWAEAPTTRIVWITMLALADKDGHVDSSTSGLARFANVTLVECRKALNDLSAPDLDSESPEWGGRRIEKVEGGWQILNYLKYRELRSPKQVADAERQQAFRERQKTEKEAAKNRDTSQVSQKVAATVAVAVDASSSSKGKSVENEEPPSPADRLLAKLETDPDRAAFDQIVNAAPSPSAWTAECLAALDGMHYPPLTPKRLGEALRDYVGNGSITPPQVPNFKHFRRYLENAAKAPREAPTSQTDTNGAKRPDSVTAGEPGALLARLKSHGETDQPSDVRQAVRAVGGLAAIQAVRPEKWGFLIRDFGAALVYARANPEATPEPKVYEPPAEVESAAMKAAREREEAWLADHPGERLPADFHFPKRRSADG